MLRIRLHKITLLLFLIAGFFGEVACKKDNNNAAPVITNLRASSPAPNDSVLTIAGPGQTVVIQGSNLASASAVFFNGYPAVINSALYSDNNIVITIPADMPFADLNPDNLNTVKVITPSGEATFTIPIVPPPAVITAMSNENALGGVRVKIYGSNFFFVEKVVFPGNIEVSDNIVTNKTGSELEVTVPDGITTGGPITVVNRYGVATSILLFNDQVTGVLTNSDDLANLEWGCETVDDATLFPGGHGKYNRIRASAVGAGDMGWWNGSRSLNTFNTVHWVPAANVNDPLDSYALKFEISVKQPWSAGRLYIVRNYDWTYLANYQPWKKSDGTTATFAPDGWQTAVIPLTQFRTKANGLDGTGDSAPNLKTLVGNDGTGSIHFLLVNPDTDAISEFDVAIDNVRIVKIK
jgi:hypothetical protein